MSTEQWDDAYLADLLRGAAAEAARYADDTSGVAGESDHRRLMRAVLVLVADAGAPALGIAAGWPPEVMSGRTGDRDAIEAVDLRLTRLERLQGEDGLFSSEGNLHSPPDTSFTINDLCLCVHLLRTMRAHSGPHPGWEVVRARLEAIGALAAGALVRGGVHTPNHRWELASALAALYTLLHDPALRARAERWLAEGIDIDSDGLYSERSAIYAAEVTNPSLLSLARDLERPELVDVVRRNLHAIAPLVEDDGEVENVHSRRQDQRLRYDAELFLVPLRTLALADSDGGLARLAREILARGLRHPGHHLAQTLRQPGLARALPPEEVRSHTWDRHYPESRLLRIRRGEVSASIFAGSDVPRTGRIASGLANSATFLRARAGGVVLRSVRVVPEFFSMGYVRPDRLEPAADGALLQETRVSGYYGPHPDGPAPGEPQDEGRYFAVMDFGSRELEELSLTSAIRVTVDGSGVVVHLGFTGVVTRYAIELVLDGEWSADGLERLGDAWWLRGSEDDGDEARATLVPAASAGTGTVRVSATGVDAATPRTGDGEMFEYVRGNDAIPGTRILLGGSTARAARLRVDLG